MKAATASTHFSSQSSSQSSGHSEAQDYKNQSPSAQFELTTAQRLLWLGQKLAPDSPLYNMAFLFTLNGEVDVEHFQAAFQAVVERSDALRTVIDETEGAAKQQVLPQLDYAVFVLDFREEADPEAVARVWAEDRAQKLFDLSVCLFDTVLIRLPNGRTMWYLNQHHLITDIASVKLLFETVSDCYQRSQAGTLADMPSLPAYTAVDLATPSAQSVDHWRQCEANPVALYHRTAGQVSSASQGRSNRVSCELGPERTAALKTLAMDSEATALTPALSLFNVVAGILFAYLARVSQCNQLAVATPAHGRPTRSLKETLGVFIELFPLLAEVEDGETFASLLAKVSESSGQLLRYAEPGASESAPGRDVNVVLNFIPTQISDFAGMSVRSEWVHAAAADPRHHLRLQVHDFDRRGSLQLHFDFNEDVFDRELQARVPSHFLALVDAVLADRHQLIADVNLVGREERSHLFSLAQSPPCEPVCRSVVALFEAQVERTPGAIATTCESQQLTYKQLNAKANQLAHYLRTKALRTKGLRTKGVEAESPIGICLNRSTEMLIAIFAVLKAGGAYVPIEPSHPSERISYILQDTQVHWVLTHSTLAHRLVGNTERLLIDAIDLSEQSDSNLEESPTLSQLAYLLYTSGSTGLPKGVAIEHRSLVNYVQWGIAKYVRGRLLSFPLFTPLAFDLTVTSVFVPLLSGGQVVIYPEGEEPIDLSLQRIFQENAVDVIKLTPSHLSLVQGMPLGSRVKTLILGGEDLKSALATEVVAGQEGLELYNEYGPTEATVGCMIHRFDASDAALSVPIGKPAMGSEIYLLDERMNLVLEGDVGEIFIGGPGLARGYFNRAELTVERFVVWEGRRLYKTGDLGRWRADGVLLYLGRCDRQVKIRGHRVELGEIEAAVAAHPQVTASAVSVVHPQVVTQPSSLSYCTQCGLASNYPGVSFDEAGVCDICRTYETYRHRAEQYFRSMEALRVRLDKGKQRKTGDYDCMMLRSGGKDSTYALAQLVHMGYSVFAFTLDNGYISEGAKENIRRVVKALDVDHVFGTTPAMNEIFVDSLERHCNVCNGCFKTIYTLSMQMAYDMGIPTIVTGLSRGQFFETRLSEEWFTQLFGQPEFDPDTIDETVLEARKVYHRSDDAVSQLMDVSAFESDDIFEAIEIVDFYRYSDVELAEMLAFLRDRLPWIRPADTGRSTNCLINDAGIYVHKQQRGYHNYALPYSWDVRMGHKTVDECIDELNDEINVGEVKQMLKEIGFDAQRSTEAQLAAYYCTKEGPEEALEGVLPNLSTADLREFLAQRLPSTLVPAYLIPLDTMPLTANGKVDVAALPAPQSSRPELASTFVAPQTGIEKLLAKLWQQVLKVDTIGIHDNFFDLGGDSIMAIQIAARLSESGFVLSPNDIFQYPTLSEIAGVVAPEVNAAPEVLAGEVPLTPIQQAFFELEPLAPEQFTQTVLLDVDGLLDSEILRMAVRSLTAHHDSLRLSYERTESGWVQRYQASVSAEQFSVVSLASQESSQRVKEEIERLQKQLNLAEGDLVRAVLFDLGERQQLGIVVHHLVVDAVSWQTLVKDLETVYGQLQAGEDVVLPPKTSSFKAWAEGLKEVELAAEETAYWENVVSTTLNHRVGVMGFVDTEGQPASQTISRQLDRALTQKFLQGSNRPQEKILAAVTLALTRQKEESTHCIDLEGHGREESLMPGARLVRTVGWFTTLFPLVLVCQEDETETLRAVKTALQKVPQHGIGYGILKYLKSGAVSDRLKEQPAAEILFNYLGALEQLLPAQSMFKLAEPLQVSRSTQQKRSHPVEVSAFLREDQLQIDWCYSKVDTPTVQALADETMKQLQLLTAEPSDTPVAEDFPLANLDSQKLDKLSSLLGKLDGLEGRL
ncbi:MAG: amino acid adenylation domain-containing protein [Phormidesmis sp.]